MAGLHLTLSRIRQPAVVGFDESADEQDGLVKRAMATRQHLRDLRRPLNLIMIAARRELQSIDPEFIGSCDEVIGLSESRRGTTERIRSEFQDATGKLPKGVLPVRMLGKPVYEPGPTDKIAQVPSEWTRR